MPGKPISSAQCAYSETIFQSSTCRLVRPFKVFASFKAVMHVLLSILMTDQEPGPGEDGQGEGGGCGHLLGAGRRKGGYLLWWRGKQESISIETYK
jgi:hypothetical protein